MKAKKMLRAERLASSEVTREAKIQEALDTADQLQEINSTCLLMLREAREDGNRPQVLQITDRLVKIMELQGKLLGNLQDGTQVNVITSPQFAQLQQVIVGALDKFPDAKSRVVEALASMANTANTAGQNVTDAEVIISE
jgi:hypothetical protein